MAGAIVGVVVSAVYFALFLWDAEDAANDEYGSLYAIAWTIFITIPFAAWCLAAFTGSLWRRSSDRR